MDFNGSFELWILHRGSTNLDYSWQLLCWHYYLSCRPESLGIVVGIVFLVVAILFQYFNFTSDSNVCLLLQKWHLPFIISYFLVHRLTLHNNMRRVHTMICPLCSYDMCISQFIKNIVNFEYSYFNIAEEKNGAKRYKRLPRNMRERKGGRLFLTLCIAW